MPEGSTYMFGTSLFLHMVSLSPLGYAGLPTSTVASRSCSLTQQLPSKRATLPGVKVDTEYH